MKKITKTLLLPIISLLLIIPFTGCEPCEDEILAKKPVIYI